MRTAAIVACLLFSAAAPAQQDARDNDRRVDRDRWAQRHYHGDQSTYRAGNTLRAGDPDPYASRAGAPDAYAPRAGDPDRYAPRAGAPNPYATRGGDPVPSLTGAGGTRRR